MQCKPHNLTDRQTDLDFLRVVSMFAVVFLHSSAKQYDASEISSNSFLMANLYDSLVRWAVPVFVMISGALFLNPQKEVTIRMIFQKYIRRIVVTFIIWSAAYAIVYNRSFSVSTISSFVTGHYHLWYLYLIVGLYLCVPILRAVTTNQRITEYFLILSAVFTFVVPTFLDVAKLIVFTENASILKTISSVENIINSKLILFLVLGYTPYFVLGYYLKNAMIPKHLEFCIYALGIVGCITTFVLTMQASKISGTKINFYSYRYFGVALESIAVYVFAKCRIGIGLAPANFFGKSVTFLSKISFGVYLVHVIVLDAVYKFLPITLLPIPLVVPVMAFLTSIVSIVISSIINRMPYLQKIV